MRQGILLILSLAAMVPTALARQVRIDGGLIAGTASSDGAIHIYKGVPYAAAPIGHLRWRPPQQVSAWDGVRKADHYSPTCMQPERPADSVYSPGYEPTSEDCLYLNIWSPDKSAQDRLPVMVWIHGGGFRLVSGSEKFFDGSALARQGVIVVTFNYRLGAFGFLAHPELSRESERHVSGNYGVLDQVAALEWVKRNIAAFGGDPGRVTIFGQSAGAISVCYLLASPLARGLFVHAIAESTVACLGPPEQSINLSGAEQAGEKFAAAAHAASVADLRALPAADLLKVAGSYPFRPVVDGYFLPEAPYRIFAQGGESRVPVLVGSNGDEGTLLSRPPESSTVFQQQARRQYGEHADEFLKLYPAGSDAQARESNYTLWRDQVALQARLLAEFESRGGMKAYRYYFSHKPPIPPHMFREQATHELGAYHSSEIEYVFDNLNTRPYLWTDTDRTLAKDMSAYWVNFTKRGDPNGAGLPKWPAADARHDVVLEFGDTIQVRRDFEKPALDFFQSLLATPQTAD